MADFLDIPEEVVQRHVLPFLKLGDIVRFRRVCKLTKSLVDEFLRLEKFKGDTTRAEIEVNEGDKSLSSLLKLEIKYPATRFYIKNSDLSFFDNPQIPEFLEKYGKQITHLRVHHFFTFTAETELKFYESFPNLISLELEEISYTKTDKSRFPANFRNLKILKLGLIHRTLSTEMWDILMYVCMKWIRFCNKLEYFGHPWFTQFTFEDGVTPPLNIDCEFVCITGEIKGRAQANPSNPNIKFYDLQNYHVNDYLKRFELGFVEMMNTCIQFDVKLLNIDSRIISQIMPLFMLGLGRFPRDLILSQVISVINLQAANFICEARHLEKIVIEKTSCCSFDKTNNCGPRWPMLKKVDITVDSKYLAETEEAKTIDLLNFLFANSRNVRYNLVDLSLQFDSEIISRSELPCPKAVKIISTCPKLKKLTITNWPGTNKALSLLWEGLEKLEEICLGNCQNLGNSAFVGERSEDPSFLSLKCLKKLTLKSLDKMPKITDTVFRLVLCHLKLKQFYLTSSAPIKSVTLDGIRSLQTGVFNNTIERFPFQDWSLFDVSTEQFKELESEFRSSQMN